MLRCRQAMGPGSDTRRFGVLAAHLRADHPGLHHSAIQGLKGLEIRETRQMLWQAREFTLDCDAETRDSRA